VENAISYGRRHLSASINKIRCCFVLCCGNALFHVIGHKVRLQLQSPSCLDRSNTSPAKSNSLTFPAAACRAVIAGNFQGRVLYRHIVLWYHVLCAFVYFSDILVCV
jgi:hypothetical protein